MKYLSILVVGVALLAGGCGEKVREVKEDELEIREKLWYFKGENKPFTGTGIDYYRDGSKSHETPHVDGKRHGASIWYFKDGSTKTSEWVHGTGTEIQYHSNGSKLSETPFANGKKHGVAIWYYEDGSKKKKIEIVYENGKEISRKNF